GPFALGGDVPKLTMLFDRFAGLADRLTDEEADAVARYSLWTQLRCGSTTVADTGSLNRPDRLAAAATALGMRCSLTTWAADAVCPPGEDRFRRTRDTDTVLAAIEDLLRRYPSRPGGRLRVRPSALYAPAMTDELGRGLADLVQRHDTPFVTHVAALRTESATTRGYFGETPIRRLAALGLLSDRLMAVHCGFVDDDERKLLLAAGVHVSHSPAKYGPSGESTLSETQLIPALVADGGSVSLSTDGASLPLGGMPEAMRAAWQAHNELAADPTRLPPSRALAMATRLAARGLRWDDEIGSLAVGKQADLVLVPADDWRYLLNPRPLEAFLSLGGSSDVDTVVVGGRVQLRGGRHVELDERELRDRYLAALRSYSARELGVPDTVLTGVFDGRN
ncbi:MAG TPA: amidohydrolase family protein, partial [Micromonosporaceae bacterium]|nr:amidohydrolase family protein [Micromonosporaceae bacterium]